MGMLRTLGGLPTFLEPEAFPLCQGLFPHLTLAYFSSHGSTNANDILSRIPGRLNDRRTPLGELNWIFTAITDTIAWNVLPRGKRHHISQDQ